MALTWYDQTVASGSKYKLKVLDVSGEQKKTLSNPPSLPLENRRQTDISSTLYVKIYLCLQMSDVPCVKRRLLRE